MISRIGKLSAWFRAMAIRLERSFLVVPKTLVENIGGKAEKNLPNHLFLKEKKKLASPRGVEPLFSA